MTVAMANGTNIKGIVAYESIGYVFPTSANITGLVKAPGFGPFVIPDEQFKKLANLTAVQFVWGNYRGEGNGFVDGYVKQSRMVSDLINGLAGMRRY
jgi:hypothetical protein